MPFLPVKCPNCGGNIELDDQREKGFCMYCGSQIVYKEAVQKMELSGVVSVKGVADKEKILQNAEIFVKLNEYKKASAILLRVTDDYPEDYRGWWQLAKFAISCPFKAGIPDRMRELVMWNDLSFYGRFIFCSEFQSKNNFIWYSEGGDEGLVPSKSLYHPVTLMRNAVNLAPTETATEMKRQVKEWLQTYMAFYSLALKYLQEDVKKAHEDPRYHLWKINQECQKRAHELNDCNEKKVFKSKMTYIDFYNKELIKAKISQSWPPLPEDNTTYHFAWDKYDERGWVSETCLRTHDHTENVLKQGATQLQEQIKEFDL